MTMLEKKHVLFGLSKNRINIYILFSYFISCAFIGWIFETTEVFIRSGHFTERGLFFINNNPGSYFHFLNSIPIVRNISFIWGLPIIEIYGIGGCVIIFFFSRLERNPVILFFTGMFFLTLLELLSSYFCDFILHQKYWDYSANFLNFQGRICLRSSVAWGVLSVFTVKFLKSKLELIYDKERRLKNFKTIVKILITYTIICIFYKYFLLRFI